MNIKRIINTVMFSFVIVISACILVACQSKNSELETKKIIDCSGVEVEIPSKINKVICPNQNAMEFMIAMGQREKLIGVHKSVFIHTWSKEFIDDLESIKGYGYTPAAEAVYESGADLVITKNATAAEELRASGIPAITFQYNNKDELFSAVTMLGEIFGDEAKEFTNKWISLYEDSETVVKEKIGLLQGAERVSAYFIDASSALDAGDLCTTAGGGSIVETWFDASGVELITKQHKGITSINEEEILEMNPGTILIGGWAENTRYEQLFKDSKWEDIDAIKNNRVYLVPDGFVSFERYAVEAPLLIEYTAYQMYPDIFLYDPVSEFQSFFKEIYNIELSEEKIEYMLAGLSPDGSRMDK